MKTYKDIYVFPLEKWEKVSWVYDQANNFTFQFESKFDKKGNFAQGWKEFEGKVMDCLNGINPTVKLARATFIHESGRIYLIRNDIKTHIITIRGWGNLTAIHELSPEEASNVQNTFAEFIINKLNEK